MISSNALALDTFTVGTIAVQILSNFSHASCESATDLYLLMSVITVSLLSLYFLYRIFIFFYKEVNEVFSNNIHMFDCVAAMR